MTGAVMCVGGCGGGAEERVVARVGPAAITSGMVERWTSALAGGRVPSDQSRRQALQAQALASLISAQWALGEAAADGIKLSGREVKRQFEKKRSASFPGGEAELKEFLKATGQRLSDIMFEAKAELASAKIRQLLASKESPITSAQIASYYGRHRQSFLIPERREIEVTNRKSEALAQAIKRQVASGSSFASAARPFKRESIELSPLAYSASRGIDAALPRAVHFARANVLTGPVLVHGIDYYVFEVRRITPARQQTLAQVQGTISQQLAAEQQRRALAAFIAAWRRRWIARTSCAAGYVVQKCRQYSGAKTPEDPMAFD
jgi:foldase protein PrsA